MIFKPFNEYYPKISEIETPPMLIKAGADASPRQFIFIDLHCDDRKCDCRRVLIRIYDLENYLSGERLKQWGTISYGWEPFHFYRNWSKGLDDDDVREFKGPALDKFQTQSDLSDFFLEQFKTLVRKTDYRKQLVSRYAKVKFKQNKKLPKNLKPKLGLLKPCGCKSGMLFRNCCAK